MPVVAIDGPVGSGKSTVARAVAARLGLPTLETGAMYRAVALGALRRGLDPAQPDFGPRLAALASATPLEVGARIVLDGEDVTDQLRSPEVNHMVSAVAAAAEVRRSLVQRQREWLGVAGSAVVEGRDIGTVVCPDADLKVFLTASEHERVRRRHDEEADLVLRRDAADRGRPASPLVAASDAVVIDTTGRSVEDIVTEIVDLLASRREPGR